MFVRRSKPLKLSAAGHRLLRLAEKVLPEIEALEVEFEGLKRGKTGRLHIAIECHACFEWLFPVLEEFRKAWPDVDVDVRPGLAFDHQRELAVLHQVMQQIQPLLETRRGEEEAVPGVEWKGFHAVDER